VEAVIETPERAAAESSYRDTLERLQKALAGKVASAKLSSRLTESPACLVAPEHGISLRMARILKQAGQPDPFATLPILELNAAHPLVARLKDTTDDTTFGELGHVLYDQAVLADGGQLDDPATFVKVINRLMLEGAATKPRILLA
jgi:molecular chaperone HtpG